MGGQACVFYGAAEFSRDLDLLILPDPANLAALESGLANLQAIPIAVPPFSAAHLQRGHAVHFRCQREDVAGLRIDIMAALRGVASFDDLWTRRTTIEVDGEVIDLLAVQDLVLAKKTQRDKDWPMIRRLVEQSYFRSDANPSEATLRFWLQELRTPELLVEVAAAWPEIARAIAPHRPAVQEALHGRTERVALAMEEEEAQQRKQDREYWDPLRKELEQLRLKRRS